MALHISLNCRMEFRDCVLEALLEEAPRYVGVMCSFSNPSQLGVHETSTLPVTTRKREVLATRASRLSTKRRIYNAQPDLPLPRKSSETGETAPPGLRKCSDQLLREEALTQASHD